MNKAGNRPFLLIADDFGFTHGISRAIMDLIRTEKIDGTSAMVSFAPCEAHAKALLSIADSVAIAPQIGLHFTLTVGKPISENALVDAQGHFPPLPRLMQLALLGQIPKGQIEAELHAQLYKFEELFGRAPDYIDGHQHVHILPSIRKAFLRAIELRYGKAKIKPWLRDPSDKIRAILRRRVEWQKALLIRLFSLGFARQANDAGFLTNAGFSGFSAFDENRNYGTDFASYLIEQGARHLIMCHPGEANDQELIGLDPAIGSRAKEYAFLKEF